MKLAGAVLIFVFFSLLGIYKGDYEKKRLSECEAFAELFEYIKNQVRFFLTPTKVMYRNFANDLLEKADFCRNFVRMSRMISIAMFGTFRLKSV